MQWLANLPDIIGEWKIRRWLRRLVKDKVIKFDQVIDPIDWGIYRITVYQVTKDSKEGRVQMMSYDTQTAPDSRFEGGLLPKKYIPKNPYILDMLDQDDAYVGWRGNGLAFHSPNGRIQYRCWNEQTEIVNEIHHGLFDRGVGKYAAELIIQEALDNYNRMYAQRGK